MVKHVILWKLKDEYSATEKEKINNTEEKNEEIKDIIIESIEPTEDEHGWWQVENTITEILEEVAYTLEEKKLIKDHKELKKIIDKIDINVRDEMFKILIEPIKKHYENKKDYKVDIDYFWEEIRVYNNNI